jgi:phenylalanyl-tRNA synthetase beta chain
VPRQFQFFILMKTSLNWLNAHLDLSSHRVEELRDMLTFAGIEVEGIEQSGVESDKIADRLF